MIKWVKIDVMIDSETKPPFFVGSMFRGALGHALKRVVCINPSYKCEGCFAAKDCVYHGFYEEKNIFHPYRLDVTLQPKDFSYGLYLFEDAIDTLPYVLSAIVKAAKEEGFGKDRVKMPIKQISIGSQIVYDGKEFHTFDNIGTNSLQVDSFCPDIRLEFTMPLRIKQDNNYATKSVALHTLISNIHSRYKQLTGKPQESLGYKVEGEVTASSMKYVTMQRYSNRQNKGMSMGGLKGSMTIKGLDAKSYRYLKIGEIIAAGKQTVFGLGSYAIKESN